MSHVPVLILLLYSSIKQQHSFRLIKINSGHGSGEVVYKHVKTQSVYVQRLAVQHEPKNK